jgi:CheY-like chemotaxis protein
MRVLLVEDEAGLVSALRVALQREGYAVDTALRLADAREKLAMTEYDIVLLDVNLPDGTGFDLADDIRSGRLVAGPSSPPVTSPEARLTTPTSARASSCSPHADSSGTGCEASTSAPTTTWSSPSRSSS